MTWRNLAPAVALAGVLVAGCSSPATNTSTVLLGPPLNGGGVIEAVPYAGQR